LPRDPPISLADYRVGNCVGVDLAFSLSGFTNTQWLGRSVRELCHLYEYEEGGMDSMDFKEAVTGLYRRALRLGISVDEVLWEAKHATPVIPLTVPPDGSFKRALYDYSQASVRINEGEILQAYRPKLIDAKGVMNFLPVQDMMKDFVYRRMNDPADPVQDVNLDTMWRLRDDLGRSMRAKRNGVCSTRDLTYEAMTTQETLAAWRSIHGEGGLKIDTTRYIAGVQPSWEEWSGSRWVAMMAQQYRDDESQGRPVPENSILHFAFAPDVEPETEKDHETVRRYGRWISQTDWEPPEGS
jgi:hypothetical protein